MLSIVPILALLNYYNLSGGSFGSHLTGFLGLSLKANLQSYLDWTVYKIISYIGER